MIVVVGLSHRTAPINIRERLAIGRDALPELLRNLTSLDAVGEAVVLSTCNRVEVYASARPDANGERCTRRTAGRATYDPELCDRAARSVASMLASIGGDHVVPHLARVDGRDAVLHLFRVAASLDSLVVGEPQILGQLKDAIDIAREHKALGSVLGHAMHRAVRVGKRVRSETQIGAGQVSISSVAVDLAHQIFGDLQGHVAVLVGAGEMAEAAAKLFARGGTRLEVVNRSFERAQALATEVGGTARPWSELHQCIVEADIVVSSTSSPTYVLTHDLVKAVRKARKGRSLFLIDIAVPRDIDPDVQKLENVFRYDIDDLSQIVAESLEGRAAEAARAEAIVREEASGFELWTLERAMTPAIVGLRARTRAVLAAEVERSLSGKLKHLSPPDREALGMMIDAATNKLLHAPVTRLKTLAADPRAADYVEALRDLFDLPDIAGEAFDEASAPEDGKAAKKNEVTYLPSPRQTVK